MDTLTLTLSHGGMTLVGALTAAVLMLAAGVVGGIIGALIIGAKDLGAGLASMMGAFYGPLAAAPAAVIVFILTAFIL